MNTSKRDIWAGRILAGIVNMILVSSSIAKISGVPKMVDGLTHAGIPQAAILPIAVLELLCLLLYWIPRTTLLGTFLLTGYFGGATVTHIIAGENILPPLIVGLIIWAGAYFRIPELQDLLPLRKGREIPEPSDLFRHTARPKQEHREAV
jgi:hypothetical protein